jgi:hypothetical protein
VTVHFPNAPPSAQTLVNVYANPLVAKTAFFREAFPQGSILEEKHGAAESAWTDTRFAAPAMQADLSARPELVQRKTLGQGVMIKHGKGFSPMTDDWEFAYYPSAKGASFTGCIACHKSAPHDFVFARYLRKSP